MGRPWSRALDDLSIGKMLFLFEIHTEGRTHVGLGGLDSIFKHLCEVVCNWAPEGQGPLALEQSTPIPALGVWGLAAFEIAFRLTAVESTAFEIAKTRWVLVRPGRLCKPCLEASVARSTSLRRRTPRPLPATGATLPC